MLWVTDDEGVVSFRDLARPRVRRRTRRSHASGRPSPEPCRGSSSRTPGASSSGSAGSPRPTTRPGRGAHRRRSGRPSGSSRRAWRRCATTSSRRPSWRRSVAPSRVCTGRERTSRLPPHRTPLDSPDDARDVRRLHGGAPPARGAGPRRDATASGRRPGGLRRRRGRGERRRVRPRSRSRTRAHRPDPTGPPDGRAAASPAAARRPGRRPRQRRRGPAHRPRRRDRHPRGDHHPVQLRPRPVDRRALVRERRLRRRLLDAPGRPGRLVRGRPGHRPGRAAREPLARDAAEPAADRGDQQPPRPLRPAQRSGPGRQPRARAAVGSASRGRSPSRPTTSRT